MVEKPISVEVASDEPLVVSGEDQFTLITSATNADAEIDISAMTVKWKC